MLKVSNITASPLRFSRLKINRRLRDDWGRISLKSPISKSYDWKIFGYISLHVRWVIYRPVKITIRNGYGKSDMYFLPLHAVLSKGVSYARLPAMRPAGSNPGVDAICRLSLLLVLSLSPRGFSPVTVYWHILCLPFFDQAVLFVSFWAKGEVLPQWLVHDSSVFVLWWCHVNICTHQGNHVIISVETCLVSLIPYYFMYTSGHENIYV